MKERIDLETPTISALAAASKTPFKTAFMAVGRLGGGCVGCPGRAQTFNEGIKPFLLENYPEVKEVRLV